MQKSQNQKVRYQKDLWKNYDHRLEIYNKLIFNHFLKIYNYSSNFLNSFMLFNIKYKIEA